MVWVAFQSNTIFNLSRMPSLLLCTPKRVALPLLSKVKAELNRMEDLGVISKVEAPTAWCADMVVVPKADGNIRIPVCVDLTKVNESV